MLPTESIRRLSKNRSKVKKTTHVKNHCLRAIPKNCIFPNIQLKGVVNRLPSFKNLPEHTNRFLMR